MPEFGMREARKTLSRLIERAQYGEEVVITQDGIPVARLLPIRRAKATPEAASEPEREPNAEPDGEPTDAVQQ